MNIYKQILVSTTESKLLSSSVKQTKFGELSILVIQHKSFCAAVSLQGAHLLFWQPSTEQTTVIWLSKQSKFERSKIGRASCRERG